MIGQIIPPRDGGEKRLNEFWLLQGNLIYAAK